MKNGKRFRGWRIAASLFARLDAKREPMSAHSSDSSVVPAIFRFHCQLHSASLTDQLTELCSFRNLGKQTRKENVAIDAQQYTRIATYTGNSLMTDCAAATLNLIK